MKFDELKINLKNRIESSYVLIGEDEYLLSSAYNLILKYSEIEVLDLNLIKFNESPIDCNDVIRALDTMPVFSKKKLVYLDARMLKKSDIKNSKKLNEYLENPNMDAILVLNFGANDETFDINTKIMTVVDCNRLDFKIISLKINATFNAKNKKISSDAIQLLSDYCLGDLSKILLECDKLIAYVGDRETISVSDITAIVTRSIEYQIFELTDALSKKNSTKVYTILDDMKAKKDEYKTLPALIYSHFRRLFQVSLNANMSNYDLSKLLGVKEYAVKMTQQQVKLFSKTTLKKINDLCIKLDFDLKQSNITIDNAINLIIVSILNM